MRKAISNNHSSFSFRSVFFVVNFVLLLALSSVFAVAQETGGVKGKIRTNKGDGIGGVSVSARLNGSEVKSVKSDEKGNFTLNGLDPGVYTIVFDKSGYNSAAKYNVEVKKDKTIDLGERLILGTDIGTQVIVKGSVFDQNGRSIYGAKIEIQKVNGDGSTRKIGSGYTSQSGEFTFRFKEGAAKFRIVASAKGASASKEVEVESAAIYRTAITLNLLRDD
jgi:hypothetical protein